MSRLEYQSMSSLRDVAQGALLPLDHSLCCTGKEKKDCLTRLTYLSVLHIFGKTALHPLDYPCIYTGES
jgi:hypothetical protein